MTLHPPTALDLVLGVALLLVVLGALRRGAGLLSAVASGLLASLVVWLAAGAVLALGPAELRDPVARTGFTRTFDPPVWAFNRLARHA